MREKSTNYREKLTIDPGAYRCGVSVVTYGAVPTCPQQRWGVRRQQPKQTGTGTGTGTGTVTAVISPPSPSPPRAVYSIVVLWLFVCLFVCRGKVSGLVFSGSLATAMSIVGSDFVTKSGFMFAGERLWNRVRGV